MATRSQIFLTDEGITPQEALFADHYVIDWNGRAAAARVGVPPRSAAQWASTRLRQTLIRAAVDRRIATLRTEAAALRARVVRELAAIATSRISHYCVSESGRVSLVNCPDEDAGDALAAVKRVTREVSRRATSGRGPVERVRIRLELWDKNSALRTLGLHFGMYGKHASTRTADEPAGLERARWAIGRSSVDL
ncbi:MAG: terminase small subunit [Acidobacteriota bacterium]|nr:terminase small subunit [Acidobacteriota bacterium]